MKVRSVRAGQTLPVFCNVSMEGREGYFHHGETVWNRPIYEAGSVSARRRTCPNAGPPARCTWTCGPFWSIWRTAMWRGHARSWNAIFPCPAFSAGFASTLAKVTVSAGNSAAPLPWARWSGPVFPSLLRRRACCPGLPRTNEWSSSGTAWRASLRHGICPVRAILLNFFMKAKNRARACWMPSRRYLWKSLKRNLKSCGEGALR